MAGYESHPRIKWLVLATRSARRLLVKITAAFVPPHSKVMITSVMMVEMIVLSFQALFRGSVECRCNKGFYRRVGDNKSESCTRPPTRPRNLTVTKVMTINHDEGSDEKDIMRTMLTTMTGTVMTISDDHDENNDEKDMMRTMLTTMTGKGGKNYFLSGNLKLTQTNFLPKRVILGGNA